MSRNFEIGILVEDLRMGGVERAVSFLANRWAAEGHRVSIVTFENFQEKSFYEVDARVKILRLGDLRRMGGVRVPVLGSLIAVLRLRFHLKKNFDLKNIAFALIGFLPHMCTYARLASLGLSLKMISSERLYPAFEFVRNNPIYRLSRFLTFLLSDGLVIQTEIGKKYFSGVIQNKTFVIPNAIPSTDLVRDPAGLRENRIISVGRLEQQKRFDLVIEAFSRLAGQFPSWKLLIVGEGRLQETLKALVQKKNISDRVDFIGATRDLNSLLASSAFLAMASDYEGFPNVLTESMSLGLPAIYTNCLSGPGEIIQNEVDGILIPTGQVAPLVEAMDRLMSDKDFRIRLGENAKKNIQRYAWPSIRLKWNEVFQSLGLIKGSR